MLGKQLNLFTICQLVGSGLILWMPKGAIVRGLLENFIKDELIKRGYQPVYTPHIGKLELYQTSGHFPYYKDAQFPPMYFNPVVPDRGHLAAPLLEKEHLDDRARAGVPGADRSDRQGRTPGRRRRRTRGTPWDQIALDARGATGRATAKRKDDDAEAEGVLKDWLSEQEGYLLKPMNCPHHIQIYKAEPRSYRDLPVRLAEFGTVYRYEQSGELTGMTRVRGFTQDDAHLFCTPEQVEARVPRRTSS